MHRHSTPLPIIQTPSSGESGVGFLLRLAATNGINMHKLRQLVGMTETETFTAKYSDGLFALVGLAVADQSELLPQGIRGGGVACYGHRFRVRTMLRFRRPQLCPACVRETRLCAAHWERYLLRHRSIAYHRFCAACLATDKTKYFRLEWRFKCWRWCPIHSCLLRERCPHCNKVVMLPGDMYSAGPEGLGIATLDRWAFPHLRLTHCQG